MKSTIGNNAHFVRLIDWTVLFTDNNHEDPLSRVNSPNSGEVPTLPASAVREENVCPVCQEEFDQFYKQDFDDEASFAASVFDKSSGGGKKKRRRNRPKSEAANGVNNDSDDDDVDVADDKDDDGGMWHLKNAVRDPDAEPGEGDRLAYHPNCLQDKKKAETANSSNLMETEDLGREDPEEKMHVDDENADGVIKDESQHIDDEAHVAVKTEEGSPAIEAGSTIVDIKAEVDKGEPREGDPENDGHSSERPVSATPSQDVCIEQKGLPVKLETEDDGKLLCFIST